MKNQKKILDLKYWIDILYASTRVIKWEVFTEVDRSTHKWSPEVRQRDTGSTYNTALYVNKFTF